MVRRAILIASEKESKKSPSNRNDVAFLHYLLKTPLGGNWKKSEIIVLLNPTLKAVLSVLKQSSEAHRFLYFSGHGCMSEGRQYILLENKLVDISLLVNRVNQEFALFDCCRNIYVYSDLDRTYEIYNAGSNFVDIYKKASINSASKSKSGKLVIFTSSAGKASRTSNWCSCFMYLFAKSVKKIQELQITKPVSPFCFLKLISLFFSRSKVTQECELYIYYS
jgi:hypothetical protein